MKWERPQKGKDRARENSRKQKPEVMPNTIAHPLTTNPTSPQTAHSLLFPVSTLSLMFYGIPLTTSAALVILPHSFLCPCLLAVHGKWRTPWFMGNNKNTGVLSTLFSHWIQNRALYWPVGRKLTLSKPKVGQYPTIYVCMRKLFSNSLPFAVSAW